MRERFNLTNLCVLIGNFINQQMAQMLVDILESVFMCPHNISALQPETFQFWLVRLILDLGGVNMAFR